jgi:hypothetical protein
MIFCSYIISWKFRYSEMKSYILRWSIGWLQLPLLEKGTHAENPLEHFLKCFFCFHPPVIIHNQVLLKSFYHPFFIIAVIFFPLMKSSMSFVLWEIFTLSLSIKKESKHSHHKSKPYLLLFNPSFFLPSTMPNGFHIYIE